MMIRYRKSGVRTFAVNMALISFLGVAGCEKTSVPEEPTKSIASSAPIAASPTKSQKAELQRVDPASTTDRAQAAAVRATFAADSRLKSFAIDVRAANGAVELFWTVDSKSSREKAERIAAGVAGVESVRNHLVLVSGS